MNEALKKDREPIDGRPIFVSKCDPDKHTRQHSFKYSTTLEKNKLFVKGMFVNFKCVSEFASKQQNKSLCTNF